MRYRYRFACLGGWAPAEAERGERGYLMSQVAPIDLTWDMGGGGAMMSVTAEADLGDRWPLEGLQLVVQALNTASVYVHGWPAGQQSVTDRPTGGAHMPPVATGAVTCSAMEPVI